MNRPQARSESSEELLRIPWSRIVEIAEEVQRKHATSNNVEPILGLRLAHAVLQFQEQLVAGMLRSDRRP